jgi:hypothetical protein
MLKLKVRSHRHPAHRPDFFLDCNTRGSGLREYNCYRDDALADYFSSRSRKRLLRHQGIVNRKGEAIGKWKNFPLPGVKKSSSPYRKRHEKNAASTDRLPSIYEK